MAADATEEQKQLIQLAASLGLDILATGGAFTDEKVIDASVLTLFTRSGTQYTYTIGGTGPGGGGIFGSEFEIFQSLAQSNTGSASTDKVDATTASKPAGTYRVGFYCDITNSDGTDIWEVQFLVNGTPIHQHSNGGDLYQNKPDGNNDWSSESSVHYITLGSPATIDLNIKFGTNDNTARAANATIEIWRVS